MSREDDRCECGHARWEHTKRDRNIPSGCEGHIDRDPSWYCKCEGFVLGANAHYEKCATQQAAATRHTNCDCAGRFEVSR